MAVSRQEIERRKDLIAERLKSLREVARARWGNNPQYVHGHCWLDFTLRGAKAGTGSNVGKISLNIDMVAGDSFDHILNETLPHEYAHVICLQNRWDRGHGKNWKMVAQALGCTGKRCHDEPVKYARGNTYEYTATCGASIRVSQTIHNRIRRGLSYKLKSGGKLNSKCEYKMV